MPQDYISVTRAGRRGAAVITVNGRRPLSNHVRINGVDANSVGTNSASNIAVCSSAPGPAP